MSPSLRRLLSPVALALCLASSALAAEIRWSVGDEVMALGKDGSWYYAEVKETKDSLYHVNFIGLYDEWIDGSRIRPRTAAEIQTVTTGTTAQASAPGDKRVQAALAEAGLPARTDEDGDYKLELDTSDGRTQLVWVMSSTQEWGSLEIREVWSPGFHVAGHLDYALARRLLTENNEKKLGAWRIMGTGDNEVAVFAVHLDADTSPSALKDVIDLVKKIADDMERSVEGTDKL